MSYIKFRSSVKKNSDVPFYADHKVYDVALMPSVLRGSETRLSADIKVVNELLNASKLSATTGRMHHITL